jgi:glycosyltransferase involved in cell wall biosynthesis
LQKDSFKDGGIILTIAVPTYNRCRYLKELLPQLVSQCDEADINATQIELILSDNSTTDETAGYAESLTSTTRLKYYRNEENVGAGGNYIKCVERAHGRYVWLFGDDELLKQGAIAKVINVLKEHPVALVILNAQNYKTGLNGSQLFESYRSFASIVSKKNPHLLLAHTLITVNVFKKELFDEEKVKSLLSTSYPQTYSITDKLREGGSVYVIDEPIVYVRSERPLDGDDPYPPGNLLLKQVKYLYHLGGTYGNARIKFFAIKYYIITWIKKKAIMLLRRK